MSDYDDNDDLDTPTSPLHLSGTGGVTLRSRQRRRSRRTAEAEAAKRELAFLKAGIDLDSPGGKLLAKAYDGAPTVEAIKAAAVEYGVITPEARTFPPRNWQRTTG
jgi:hypothetical protein